MRSGIRGGAAALAAALAALLAADGCGGREGSAPERADRAVVRGVETATIAQTTGTVFVEAVGTVRARVWAAVAPQVMGRITALPVSEGSRVEKGALVAAIDDAEARAQAAAAEAAVAQAVAARDEALRAVDQAAAARALAEKTFERFRSLHEQKVVSGQEFDEAEARKIVAVREHERVSQKASQAAARIVEAQGQAKAAQAMLSHARLTAPFSGVVTARTAEAGAMAVPGQPVAVIEDTSRYRLEAAVSEEYLSVIKAGSPVEVFLDAMPGRSTAAKVSEVVPAVDPASRTFIVKVDLSGPGLRSGLFGRIRFAAGTAPAVFVPRRAVSRAGGYEGLFVIAPDNVARLAMIRTGREAGDMVEVLSGPPPGARIAVSAVDRLADGAKVEVAP